MNKINVFLIIVIIVLGYFLLCSILVNKESTTISLGNHYVFSDDLIVSIDDKQTIYYECGNYYTVQDDTINQITYYECVEQNESLIDYLESIESFSQEDATIICYDNEGNECSIDLSLPWSNCSFNCLIAYWETNKNGGILVIMSPKNTTAITEFLNYEDLLESVSLG